MIILYDNTLTKCTAGELRGRRFETIMTRKTTKKISLDIPLTTLEKVDRISNNAGVTRASFINNILEINTIALEHCKRVGILQFSLLLQDLEHSTMNWAKETKETNKKLDDYNKHLDE